ncbi:transcription cofactor vestigial-like protein 3 [Poeciliopsis prolifica]|uniref:transcription cofactor vestigial-like protein 3 n=1 Tax=Poeciliopsis prolifica TaxID=188132 RepID=UPI00072D6DEB|nr:transcription cofactor vestigial-like protein 3 [Poeciliopsis prolifica]XP_054887233.1 transcription cofactor vestigial-like protein 3 [Poeciliopsis prolifica]XP_054887234.1 transcription cofactor vestigial-like protein 3 [Poeciliopsis prolifica]XP_054887236.1 transcription cofactor vestigial-like protein 3 [Poeciliopsis prolifica]XP_054887249.1 transcription cofactor vestigial-like protein 3 [Poeciliopsis prolifica]XP_054887250.1 transcription cofactor vestigial-like protein 3 [Poeciliopsi
MEERTDSPVPVKVEENPDSVVLTYFKGDISSMVDAHFSRALGKANKAYESGLRSKKIRKTVKLESSDNCQGSMSAPYFEAPVPPLTGHILTLSSAEETPGSWNSFRSREGPAVPTIMCSLSPDGLSLTGQQYSTSLLNLLHGDRGEMGAAIASSSKPDPLPGWAVPAGYRESVDPPIGFEPGRHGDKKDLYWY